MKKCLDLTIKFDKDGNVLCAKSSHLCKDCAWGKNCEQIKCYYDPYDDIDFCRRNDYRKK